MDIIVKILGVIGGILGIYNIWITHKDKKLIEDKELFFENLKFRYSECFEDKSWNSSANVNLVKVYELAENIERFYNNGNRFNDYNLNFSLLEIYEWSKKLNKSKHHFTGVIFYGGETANESIEKLYTNSKNEFEGLKKSFALFQKILLNYI